MSLKSFDEAITNYLKNIYDNTIFSPSSRTLIDATDSRTEIKLPMITVERISNEYPSSDLQSNYTEVRLGRRSDDELRERSLSIDLMYQIDIWSDRRDESDNIWREVLMYLNLDNGISITYSPTVSQDYPITIVNTDVDINYNEFEDIGKLYRNIITVKIHNAKLIFNKSINLVKEIPVRTITLTSDEKKNEELDIVSDKGTRFESIE